MHRMVPAFILAVLIHTLLLTVDARRLIRQEPVVPQARLLTRGWNLSKRSFIRQT